MKYITPIKLYYIERENNVETVKPVTSIFSGLEVETFFCEWTGEFGRSVYASQAAGVEDVCTVRMIYNPDIWRAAQRNKLIVARAAANIFEAPGKIDYLSPDLYILFGTIDNVKMSSNTMEFKVRRLKQNDF